MEGVGLEVVGQGDVPIGAPCGRVKSFYGATSDYRGGAYGTPILAGPVALPRIVLFSRVARFFNPLQTNVCRRALGVDPSGSDDADSHDGGQSQQNVHSRSASSTFLPLRPAAVAIFFNDPVREQHQLCV